MPKGDVLATWSEYTGKQPVDYKAIDEANNPPPPKSPTQQYEESIKGTNITGQTGGTIRATTAFERFMSGLQDLSRSYVAPLVQGVSVNTGRVLGGGVVAAATKNPYATAAGALGGGTAGGLVFNSMQDLSPGWLGESPSSIKDRLINAGANTVLDAGGSGIANWVGKQVTKYGSREARDVAKENFLRQRFPLNPRAKEITNAIIGDPNFPNPSVSQVTQTKFPKILEDIVTPEGVKLDQYHTQADYVRDKFSRLGTDIGGSGFTPKIAGKSGTSAVQLATLGTGKAVSEFEKSKTLADDLYITARQGISTLPSVQATQTVNFGTRQVQVPIEITEPVNMSFTSAKATEILAGIDNYIADPQKLIGSNPEAVKAAQRLRETIVGLTELPKDPNGNPIMNYTGAVNLKDSLTSLIPDSAEGTFKTKFVGAMEALRNLMSKDMRNTAETQWPKPVGQAYAKATDYYTQHYAEYAPDLVKSLTKAGYDPKLIGEKVMDQALSTGQEAAQYIAATGDKAELGAHLYQKFADIAFDARGMFNADAALKEFYLKSDVVNQLLSSDQRSQLKRVFHQMQAIPQGEGSLGKVAVTVRLGSAALGLTSGILRGVATASIPTGATTGAVVIGGFVLGSKVIQKTMLNPKNARLLAEGMRLPPASSRAQDIIKTLLKGALKGTQFEVQYQNGKPAGTFKSPGDGYLYKVTDKKAPVNLIPGMPGE